MRLPARLLLSALVLLAAACSRERPAVRLERDYLPGHAYLTEGRIESQRNLSLRPKGGAWESLADEGRTVLTRQRLVLGEAVGDSVPARLRILSYALEDGQGGRVVVLDGYAGSSTYRPSARRFEGFAFEGTLDTSALAKAADSLYQAGSLAEAIGLSQGEASEFLASTFELLGSALADSVRVLSPGDFFSEERRQEERIGPWPVRWRERSTTTLDRIDADSLAQFSILRSLSPAEGVPDSLRLLIDGEGRGRMSFDMARRSSTLLESDTRLDIELEEPTGPAWRARSSSHIRLVTSIEGR